MDRATTSRPHRSKAASGKIGKYFRRATTFSIPTRPYSPGHDRGFSGPIMPLVPAEARRRGHKGGGGVEFDVDREPTSPKVSCMGQVKKHREMCRLASMGGRENRRDRGNEEGEKKKNNNNKEKKPSSSLSVLSMIFKGKFRRAEKAPPPPPPPPPPAVVRVQAPPIGEMKRFASGRDKLGGFDWKDNGDDDKNYYSAEEREDEGPEGEKDHGISRSGPIAMGGDARKEVNLWRRRTTKQPTPLLL